MIEISGLSKRYGGITAVKDLKFSVKKGEILGFLGPNGAGKTTTMNIIAGFMPPSEGTVKINGLDILEHSQEVKRKIGYAPEVPTLYYEMTVSDFLYFTAELKKVPKKDRRDEVDKVIELTKTTDVKNRLISNLSKGYRQRVGIAQALIGNPEIIILDEPTAGLDPKQIIEIRKLIKSLGKDHTIILSSHILPEVNAVCDRVIIINKGEIAAIDTPENLSSILGGTGKILAKIEGEREKIQKALESIDGVIKVEVKEEMEETCDYIVECEQSKDLRKTIFFAMAEKKFPILEMRKYGLSLEEVFLQLTTSEKEEVE